MLFDESVANVGSSSAQLRAGLRSKYALKAVYSNSGKFATRLERFSLVSGVFVSFTYRRRKDVLKYSLDSLFVPHLSPGTVSREEA